MKDIKDVSPAPPKEKKLAEKASAAEQYRKALEHAEGIKQAAVEELRTAINTQIEELNAFGYDYHLTQKGATAKKQTSGTRQKGELCSICNFATDPPHDGRLRFHRDQGDAKKPLTEKQLVELGLKKK